MKSIHITTEFSDPAKALKTSLIDSGARNINLQPTYDGWLSVKYEIKVPVPRQEIEQLIAASGAQLVRYAIHTHGADFDLRIQEQLDEKTFKQDMIDQIKGLGYRAH